MKAEDKNLRELKTTKKVKKQKLNNRLLKGQKKEKKKCSNLP